MIHILNQKFSTPIFTCPEKPHAARPTLPRNARWPPTRHPRPGRRSHFRWRQSQHENWGSIFNNNRVTAFFVQKKRTLRKNWEKHKRCNTRYCDHPLTTLSFQNAFPSPPTRLFPSVSVRFSRVSRVFRKIFILKRRGWFGHDGLQPEKKFKNHMLFFSPSHLSETFCPSWSKKGPSHNCHPNWHRLASSQETGQQRHRDLTDARRLRRHLFSMGTAGMRFFLGSK